MCSDWLILGHNSPEMPTGQLQAYKTKAKSLNGENLKPWLCCSDRAIAQFQYISVWETDS